MTEHGTEVSRKSFHNLEKEFGILRARQRTKSLIFMWNVCQQLSGKPATPIPSALPGNRINKMYPFQVSGIDYLGPL